MVRSEGSPQDFSMNDLAVEVKCQLGSTKPTIKISSIDQLYTQMPKLVLYVTTLSKASSEHKDSINLPDMIQEIEDLIEQDASPSINRFQELLIESGYFYKDKYYDFSYLFVGERAFEVKGDFPRILPSQVIDGVEKLRYNVNLNDCNDFEIDINKWELNDN